MSYISDSPVSSNEDVSARRGSVYSKYSFQNF